MSREIDERVVEMRFDNAQFEHGVHESIDSLDELKKSLKFEDSSDGLKELQNATTKFDTKPMATAIETVSKKFSALEIAGITAISRLTDKAMSAGEQMLKSLTVDNVSAGWSKFGQKTTSVATLVAQGYELTEVNDQLERLNWFTDETSYNFTDMVSNISKFTATGQELQPSVTAMEGIATWAALSGQNATTASRAMYQLSQAMGKGVLKYDDWKSIQNASMDTKEFRENALEVAVALGKVKKATTDTGETIYKVGEKAQFTLAEMFTSEALSRQKWFDSDVMMGTFKKYSAAVDQIYDYAKTKGITASKAMEELGLSVDAFGLKAFKAAQEARTWTDVIDSVKDAVSTGWMQTFEYVFGNYEEATKLWTNFANELYDIFAESGNARNEILSEWHGLDVGGYEDLVEAFWNIWDTIRAIVNPIKQAWAAIFPAKTADQIAAIVTKIKNFSVSFKEAFPWIDEFTNFVEEAGNKIEEIVKPIEETAEAVQDLANVTELANAVIFGTYGNGEERRKALEELGYSYEIVQNKVNELMGCAFRYEVTEEDMAKMAGLNADAQAEVAEETEETAKVTDEARKRMQNLYDIFAGLFSLLRLGKTILKTIAKSILDVAKSVGKALIPFADSMLDKFAAMGRGITEFERRMESTGKISEIATNISTTVSNAIKTVIDWATRLKNSVLSNVNFQGLLTSLTNLWNVLKQYTQIGLGSLGADFGKLFDSLFADKEGLDSVDILTDVIGGLSKPLKTVVDWMSQAIPIVSEFLGSFKDGIATTIHNIGEGLYEMYHGVYSIDLKKFTDWMSGILPTLTEFFGKFTPDLAQTIQDISDGLKEIFHIDDTTLQKLTGALDNIREFFASFTLSTVFDNLKIDLSGFWQSVTDQIKGKNLEELTEIFKNTMIGAFIAALAKFVNSLGDIGTGAKNVMEAIVKTFDSVRGILVAYQDQIKANNLLIIAKAIALLALSIGLLTFVDQNALTNVVGNMLAILMVVALMFAAMSKIKGKTDGLKDVAKPFQAIFDGIKKALSKAASMVGLAAMAIGLGISLILVADAIGKFAKMPWSKYKGGVIMAAGVLTALVIAGALMKAVNGTLTVADALTLMAFGVVLKMMGEAIKTISEQVKTLNSTQLGTMIATMVGLGVFIAAMAAVTKNKMGESTGMLKFSAGLAVMALVLPLLAEGFKAFEGVDFKSMIGVSTVIVAVAGSLALLSKYVSFATVIALGVAITAFAGSLYLLKDVQLSSLTDGLIALGIALAGLMVFGFLANQFALGIYSIGVAAAGIGIGLLAGAAAIYVFAAALPLIGDGMVKLGDAIINHGEEIKAAAIAIVGIILLAIATAIIANAPAIATGITALGLNIIGAINNLVGPLISTLAVLLTALMAFLLNAIPGLTNTLVLAIVLAFENVGNAIYEYGPRLVKAITEIIAALIWTVATIIPSMIGSLLDIGRTGVTQKIKDFFHIGKKQIQEESESFNKDLNDTVNAIGGGSGGNANHMAKPLISGDKLFGNKDELMANAKAVGFEIPEEIGKGAEESAGQTDFMKQIADKMYGEGYSGTAVNAFLERASNIGADSSDELTTSFSDRFKDFDMASVMSTMYDDSETTAKYGGKTIANATTEEIQNHDKDFNRAAKDNIDSYATGIDESADKVRTAASAMVDIAVESSKDKTGRMYDNGVNLIKGLIDGINSQSAALKAAINNATKTTNTTFTEAEDINSPSGVWEDYGEYLMLGLAGGITKFSSLVVSTIGNMATEADSAMTPALNSIIGVLDGDMDSAPVIRPVMDLSNVNAGANRINSLLGTNRTYDLAVQANNSRLAAQNRVAQTTTETSTGIADRIVNGVVSGVSAALSENGEIPLHIYVEPDPTGIFKVVRVEANKFTRATGYSPFNTGK